MYLNSNKLTINTSKTTLIEMILPQRRTVTDGHAPTLETTDDNGEDKIVEASTEALLLGGTFHQTTSWKAHVDSGEEAILPKLRKKLGMLRYIGKNMKMKGKMMLANGYILSRVIYLLPLWGGTDKKYRQKIQVVLNDTARWVCGHGKRTRKIKLMRLCRWLDLEELTELHSILTLWKIIRMNVPRNLSRKFVINENDIISVPEPRLRNTMVNFKHRTTMQWNALPARIRGIKSLGRFKCNVKSWIMSRREQNPD